MGGTEEGGVGCTGLGISEMVVLVSGEGLGFDMFEEEDDSDELPNPPLESKDGE